MIIFCFQPRRRERSEKISLKQAAFEQTQPGFQESCEVSVRRKGFS